MRLGEEIGELQLRQRRHDDEYHPEIARLPVADRINHVILHFAKYARKLTLQPDNVQQYVIDALIMSLSASNVMKHRLASCVGTADFTAHPVTQGDAHASLVKSLVLGCGLMAEAREKLDHVEAYPFRDSLVEGINEVAFATCAYAKTRQWNLSNLVEERLSAVRSKALR